MKKGIFLLVLLNVHALYAQDSATHAWQFSGYGELYAQYDVNNPLNNNRPGFLYSHNRNNELNLNLAFVKAVYANKSVRANFALGAGTYMNANYAAEPGLLKNIYEANIGMRLSAKSEWWMDAGILPSHIGFESAVSKDCPTLSRSILADNSPYYETGVRISHTSQGGKWYLAFLLLNGWQHIQKPDGNSSVSLGTQLTWKPNENITLNSSSFIGNDLPDSISRMRYFHNFYGVFQIFKQFSVTAGFDIGIQKQSKNSSRYNTWYSTVLIARYTINEKSVLAARFEYYDDRNGVLIAKTTPNGFRTSGVSINYDHSVGKNILWRTEIRSLSGKDAVFQKRDNSFTNQNTAFTTALMINW